MKKNKKIPKVKLTPESAQRIYQALVRCRKFEEKIVEVYSEKEMRCPTHLSIGQEAVAAGVCSALRLEDMVFSTHRCHSHTIAKGGDLKLMFSELYGKETGCSRGKGGSMHFVQPEVGLMGSSAIVGGTVPLAVGAALASQMNGKDTVSVAFFGDGGIEQGTFHESLNFASLKKLPVIFVIENNFIATCTPLSSRQPFPDLSRRAEGYDMPGVTVDGTKASDVYFAAMKAVQKARKGDGPTLIEAPCYRWKEHVGPNTDYHLGHRTKEELFEWMKKDPVKLFAKEALKQKVLKNKMMDHFSDSIDQEIEEAIVYAKNSPFPAVEQIYQDV